MLGKIEGRRRRGQQRMRWPDDITVSIDVSVSELRELVMYRKAWHAAIRFFPSQRGMSTAHPDLTNVKILPNLLHLTKK